MIDRRQFYFENWLTTPEVSPKHDCMHFVASVSVGLKLSIPLISSSVPPSCFPHRRTIWWNIFTLISSGIHWKSNHISIVWMITKLMQQFSVSLKVKFLPQKNQWHKPQKSTQPNISLYQFELTLYHARWTNNNVTGHEHSIGAAIYKKCVMCIRPMTT